LLFDPVDLSCIIIGNINIFIKPEKKYPRAGSGRHEVSVPVMKPATPSGVPRAFSLTRPGLWPVALLRFQEPW